jgi:hypothetical protein
MITHVARRARASTLFAAAAATISLAGCGGATRSIPAPVVTTPAAGNVGTLGSTTLTITIPARPGTSGSSAARKPSYVSASTAQLAFTINSTSSPTLTSQQLAYANTQFGTKTLTLGNSTCPANGNGSYTCTFTFQIPPATYNLTLSAEDSSGNVLSQETSNIQITVAQNNAASVVLVAQPYTMTITTAGSTAYLIGPHTVASGNTEMLLRLPSGTAATTQSYTVALKDHDGNAISGSGLPTMSVTASGNTDVIVSSTTQASGTSTPYAFTLAAGPAQATPESTTPTNINVTFTDPGNNGITSLQQTFTAINGELMAFAGELNSAPAIEIYGYGDATFLQFGATITGGAELSQLPDQVQFDGSYNLYADHAANAGDPNENGTVYKIPFANLGGSAPAVTAYTWGSPKLEPNDITEMDVTPAGAVTLSNNSQDNTVDGSSNPNEEPDAIIYAPAGGTEFTFGWNNVGAYSGEGTQAAVAGAVSLTNPSSVLFGFAGVEEFNSSYPNGFAAFVYTANPGAGASNVTCDIPGTPGVATTPCWEVDTTSNIASNFIARGIWDYTNQKYVVANSTQQTSYTEHIVSFAASGNVMSTTSTVLGSISGGSSDPTVDVLAVSRNGYVAIPYESPPATKSGVLNIYNDATNAAVEETFVSATAYGQYENFNSGTNAVGFVSGTGSGFAFYYIAENINAGTYLLFVNSPIQADPIAALSFGSFTPNYVSGGTQARRRAPLNYRRSRAIRS